MAAALRREDQELLKGGESLEENLSGETYTNVQERSRVSSMPTIFIGKWTVKIMYSLKKSPQRHGQLRRALGNISQRMLTRTLRNLEFAGLITRHVTRSKSIAVEYSLTKMGKTFIIPLRSICRWADNNKKGLSAVVRLHERANIAPHCAQEAKTQLDRLMSLGGPTNLR